MTLSIRLPLSVARILFIMSGCALCVRRADDDQSHCVQPPPRQSRSGQQLLLPRQQAPRRHQHRMRPTSGNALSVP